MGFNQTMENASPVKRMIVYLLPVLIIGTVAVYFLVLPLIETNKKLASEIEKQKAEIKIAQQRSAALPALIAENERLKNKLQDLQFQLPEEREVSGLLKQVEDLGVKSGLQVVFWRPKGKSLHPSNEVYEIPVDVEMRGNYHRFGQFFTNVTRLNRIVNISNISMKIADQRRVVLSVTFSAMTYSLIPESERKALEKEKEKGKKA